MKKRAIRTRERIHRIEYLNNDGKWRSPERKFETYRYVSVGDEKRKETACFATIPDAEAFRDSTEERRRDRGLTVAEAVELWKRAHFPHLELPSRENILKVFPDPAERALKKKLGSYRELPCDYLLGDEVDSIGTLRIDQWLAHLKSPEFIATLKGTKLSFLHEYKVLNQALQYYASRVNRNYRTPFLKDHRKKLKIKDAKPRPEKDLPSAKLGPFLEAVAEWSRGSEYEGVLEKLAEAQYRSYARLQEAAAIHLEDIDQAGGAVQLDKRIQYLKKGTQRAILSEGHKANGGRIVKSAELVRLLLEVALKRGVRSGPLFFVNGKPIAYKVIQNAYNYAHRKAGTGQSSTHVLRHGALSEFQEIAKDINQTKKVAGHADLKSTLRYAKARDSAVGGSQEQVEERLRSIKLVR